MNIKSNNRFLLLFTICFLIATLVFNVAGGILKEWNLESVIPYLIFLVIGIVILRRERTPFFKALPYDRGLRPGTALLIVLLTFLLIPLSEVLGQLGAYIFGDMTGLADQTGMFTGKPFFVTLISIALVPAVFEEMYFRGFFYGAYRRARGARFAIVMTAILFGIFHANFQQTIYAFVLGIVIAVLRELTGSMWAGMLYHFVNNGFGVVMRRVDSETTQALTLGPVGTGIVTILCTLAACFVLWKISALEGKKEALRTFFRGDRGEGVRAITPALVFSILINVAVACLVSVILLSGILTGGV